jgi:hypothetical protein
MKVCWQTRPAPFRLPAETHILRAAITGMPAFERAMGLLPGFGFLQRSGLGPGQHQDLLGALGFQRLETLVHVLEIVALPHTAHTGGRTNPCLSF